MAVERTPDPTPEPFVVHIMPMRRRHVRGVLRIEQQVYPRPWTMSLFLSELALRSSRAYFVARIGRDVVGYGGLVKSPRNHDPPSAARAGKTTPVLQPPSKLVFRPPP